MAIRQTHGAVWSVLGADVASSAGVRREVDLLAISHDELIVGELKARSASFTRTYVRELSDLAAGLGADLLVLGSFDHWGEGRKEQAEKWVGKSVKTLMLGRGDLLRTPPQVGRDGRG
jgi:hypothetical protein